MAIESSRLGGFALMTRLTQCYAKRVFSTIVPGTLIKVSNYVAGNNAPKMAKNTTVRNTWGMSA